MRVDAWILQEFPELNAEQATSAQMQLGVSEQALAPSIREKFPKGICRGQEDALGVRRHPIGIDIP
jgi:hypothetical protein